LAGAAVLAALVVALVLGTRDEDRGAKVVPTVIPVDCSSRLGVNPAGLSYRLCFGPTHRLQTESQGRGGKHFHWEAASA
jgi:hypothetical protein